MRSNRRQRHVARDVMIFGFSFAIIVFFQTVSSYHHQTGIEQSMRQMKEDLLNFPSSSLSSSSSWSFVDVVTNRLEDRMKAYEQPIQLLLESQHETEKERNIAITKQLSNLLEVVQQRQQQTNFRCQGGGWDKSVVAIIIIIITGIAQISSIHIT